jgi:hypothetical protein
MPSEANRFLKAGMFYAISTSSAPIGAQDKVIWLSKPHGAPSGVCTGHVNPHDSGRSLRTVVVFISVKYWPRCIDLKCDKYLVMLSLSGTIVKPAVCCMSS